jgi:hypothetical protein
MAKVTVDLDVVDVVLGLLIVVTSAVLLALFKKHRPDQPRLRALCFLGMLFGFFLVFWNFFYQLALAQ